MEAGAPVVYQAAFLDGDWMGYVDFLERVESQSALGDWSYEPADTKLARSVKPYFVIQLCLYADLIEAIQGAEPQHIHVILGNGERRTLAQGDFRSYFRRMKELYVATLGDGLDEGDLVTYQEPERGRPRLAKLRLAEHGDEYRYGDSNPGFRTENWL